MKFRTMLGLAAVGGLLYWHRKRGGEWTMASFQDTARDLWKQLAQGARKAESTAREIGREAEKGANARVRH